MSELIWRLKQLIRKVIPIALIAGICYGGFSAYKKGWLGRNVTHQISALTHKIPFFGSKFSLQNLSFGHKEAQNSHNISRASHRRSHHRHHGRRHSSHRRHRSHR